ncbi:HotDog domain-containing protein [Mycena rosella]|uniref:HotDog domain-containing protein n=1 Tax=Mycena rosella TaxID=1033263 RepID=A0AAD7GZ52_MYCRO|nr:HotDog domain-containing protein [Mycena rosella]
MWSATHEQISAVLKVERLDVDLFRSKSLWLPILAQGAFGGQIIGQTVMAATDSVNLNFRLHCYFLSSASASVPIVYSVRRLRDGNSYITRTVQATQSGRTICVMMCSFHRTEPWQPTGVKWNMPLVPPPEQRQLEEDRYKALLKHNGVPPKERHRSPIAIKVAVEDDLRSGRMPQFMYWMQVRNIPASKPSFQKCILSYLGFLCLLSALGFERFSSGPNGESMTMRQSTRQLKLFDYFRSDTFNCGNWPLYVIASPCAVSGRAIVCGRMYSQNGTLDIAMVTQEGVVRADRRGPEIKLTTAGGSGYYGRRQKRHSKEAGRKRL